MSIKKYHKSANLFNVSDYPVGTILFITKRIVLEPNTTYTMSSNCPLYNGGALIAMGNIEESFTTANNGVYPNRPITRTTDANGKLVIGLRTNGSDYIPADYETMLNSGSTALPYEPYDPEVWHSIPYRKYGTETDAITTLPATVIGDGTPISSYIIKGNMEQSGTPTPSSPIYPSECGERTENLFDPEHHITIKNVDYIGDVYPANKYRISNMSNFPCYYKIGESGTTGTVNPPTNIYVNANDIVYVWCSVNFNKKISLTEGATLKEYEPYGYKLPVTLGSTTTNIYLGEVQTTRRIKKLVLTGEENWNTCQTSYFITVNDYYRMYDVGSHLSVCSHYPIVQTQTLPEMHYGLGGLIDGQTHTRWNGNIVFNPSPTISSRTDWQSYLAQQYAAGTPVTVWYVLAEPETAIVNEPIRKIGDYVDSISGTNLATSGTAQEFDVGTTLKPSEVDMTYHGWHEHEDTKYST